MPGFPTGWERLPVSESDANLPEELPSLPGWSPFESVHYGYLLCSTVCHLRRYLDIKLTPELNKLRTKGHWQFDSKLVYPEKDLPPRSCSCHFFMVWYHLMARLKRSMRWLAAIRQLWSPRQDTFCAHVGKLKGGKTAAPSLELEDPWLHANFLLQLFTDKTGRGRRPLLL